MIKKILFIFQLIAIFIITSLCTLFILSKIYNNTLARKSPTEKILDNQIAIKTVTIEKTNEEIPSEISQTSPEVKKDEIKKKDDSDTYCPKPKKDYEDQTYLDVGQEVELPDPSYVPDDLKILNTSSSTYKGICLKEEARDAFQLLTTNAEKDGYLIKASSGFRSYKTQEALLNNYLKNNKTTTSKSVAKPGYSEHQLGVAVDLTGSSIKYSSASGIFGTTTESKWLEVHASEYGFIQSYPKGKEDVTGYIYEPWHYRYVGIDNTKEIIKNNQTINQFLKQKKDDELAKNKITS